MIPQSSAVLTALDSMAGLNGCLTVFHSRYEESNGLDLCDSLISV